MRRTIDSPIFAVMDKASECALCISPFSSFTSHSHTLEYPHSKNAVAPKGRSVFRPLANLLSHIQQTEPPTSHKTVVKFVLPEKENKPVPIYFPPPEAFRPLSLASMAVALYSPGTISPISTLSDGVLRIIFRYASDDDADWLASLSISLVSRRWRTIAHAFPELWSHVFIDVPRIMYYNARSSWKTYEIIWWYLHLSKDAPLAVDMRLIGLDGDERLAHAVKLLVQDAPRWRRLRVDVIPEDLQLFASIGPQSLYRLKDLALNVYGTGISDYGTRSSVFRYATSLCRYAPAGCSPQYCAIPWDQLETVVLGRSLQSGLYGHLRQAQNMKHLLLDVNLQLHTMPGSEVPVPLPARKLTIRAISSGIHTLLESYIFPSLTAVDVCLDVNQPVNARFLPSFVAMIQQSSCMIKSLTLKNVHISAESLLDLLRCMPKLKSLTIYEPAGTRCVTEALLRNLTVTIHDSETVFLSKLKSLELAWSSEMNEDSILDMVESREKAGLRRVVLGRRYGRELHPPAVRRMSELRQKGLLIYEL